MCAQYYRAIGYNINMQKHVTENSKYAFIFLSAIMFFFSAEVALTIYIDSSFLKHAITLTPTLTQTKLWSDPDHMVGVIYAFASLLTIFLITIAPKTLRKIGNYRWTRNLILLQITLLLGLAMFNTGWLLIPLFVIESALISVLYYNFDIFLEHYSRDNQTGVIRGIFMAINSLAWLVPPIGAGYLIDHYGFSMVYLVGAALMLPVLLLLMLSLRGFRDFPYEEVEHHATYKK